MKKLTQHKPIALATVISSTVILSGCSGLTSSIKLPEHKIAYKNSTSVKSLEVPPDLTTPEYDDTYAVGSAGTITASDYNRRGGAAGDARVAVLPSVQGVQLKSSGNVRWLEVQAPAEALWPKLTSFWSSIGVSLKSNEPRIGVMETEWAENRAGLPKDWLRKALGTVLTDVYDAGSRDKFKLRVERPSASVTNVFVSHRRAEEMLAGGGGVKWEMRPSDPGLEAEILNRLSAYLQGGRQASSAASALSSTAQAANTSWTSVNGLSVLNVAENLKSSWVRVGVMLERLGMAIEGQDRANGIYKIIYRGNQIREEKRGWLSKIFRGSRERLTKGAEYQLHLSGSGANTLIAVTDADGNPVQESVGRSILGQLKGEFER